MAPRENESPSASLMETLLADPALLQQLDAMNSSEHTLTLDPRAMGAAERTDGSAEPDASCDAPATDSPTRRPPGPLPAAAKGRGNLPSREVTAPGQRPPASADYRLVGQLGQGGTAVVYQAHQRALDREVAIKVLRDDLVDDPLAQDRFLTEARTIGGLDHPNVIALHELAINETGQLFYSMKRVDGTSWNTVIGDQTLEQNLRIFRRVADAIRYAHSRGLLHRDIKPENVMLGRFGEVLLADWGLSLPYPLPTEARDQNSTMGGTPAYMAPEQAAGNLQAIGIHTDVYLMGGLLFHILTGFPPHFGDTLLDCIRAAAGNEIRPSRVGGELMEIAMQALATDPTDRFPSIEALLEAVHRYEHHQESINLVDRAAKYAEQAADEDGYERFGLALNLLGEATALWPDNRRANQLLTQVRVDFARKASSLGDLDLAISMLDAAGEGESELACRIRRQRRKRSKQEKREARLSTLFANSPDAVLLTERDSGTIVECNDALTGLLGYERNELVGQRIPDLELWACPERRSLFLQTLQRRGRIENFEGCFRSGDGRLIDVLISGRCVALEGRDLLVTTLRDITKRKEAENALRLSRQRLREYTRLANLGTWEFNLKTGEIVWSDETFRISGLPKQAGSPSFQEYLELVHPDDRAAMEQAVHNACENGAAYELTIRHRRADGTYNTTIARGQPQLDEAGTIVELYGTVQDISRQKVDQEEARHTAAALQSLLDWTDRPLCIFDSQGHILAASQNLCARLDRAAQCLRHDWRIAFETADWEPRDPRQRSLLPARLLFKNQPVGKPIRLAVEAAPGKHALFLGEWEEAAQDG